MYLTRVHKENTSVAKIVVSEIDGMAAVPLFDGHDKIEIMPVKILCQILIIQQLLNFTNANTLGDILVCLRCFDMSDWDAFDTHGLNVMFSNICGC